jgi:hypothetical protein
MFVAAKRALVFVAISVIAARAVFGGLVPMAAAQAADFDPFTVICHSGGGEAADLTGTPAPLKSTGLAQTCEHCVLCKTTLAGPPQYIPGAPLRLVLTLPAAERLSAPLVGTSTNPHLARGPPQAA